MPSGTRVGGTTTADGSLDSTANETFRVGLGALIVLLVVAALLVTTRRL